MSFPATYCAPSCCERLDGARRTPCLAPRALLDSLTLLTVPASTFERAADLDPDLLRGLDALHLAAALELGDDLDGVVTYDERLAAAAQLHGVTVTAPTS